MTAINGTLSLSSGFTFSLNVGGTAALVPVHTGIVHITFGLSNVVLDSSGTDTPGTPVPPVPPGPPSLPSPVYGIACITGIVRVGGNALLQFTGPANVAVSWSVISGGGSINALSLVTDSAGLAYANYMAGAAGTVVLGVNYGGSDGS